MIVGHSLFHLQCLTLFIYQAYLKTFGTTVATIITPRDGSWAFLQHRVPLVKALQLWKRLPNVVVRPRCLFCYGNGSTDASHNPSAATRKAPSLSTKVAMTSSIILYFAHPKRANYFLENFERDDYTYKCLFSGLNMPQGVCLLTFVLPTEAQRSIPWNVSNHKRQTSTSSLVYCSTYLLSINSTVLCIQHVVHE